MASKNISRETKRMLAQCDNSQNSTSMRTDKSRRSKRWKTACQQQTTEASNSFCGNNEQNSAVILNRDVSVRTVSRIDNSVAEGGYSYSIGQAFYQRIRQ
ncbi:hypothetical protein ABKV19_002594, partial [Rosa sericea]